MKQNNFARIVAGLVALALIGFIGYMANGLLGNPISKALVNRAAQNYVESQYPGQNLVLEPAYYSFKFGNYYVRVSQPGSQDIRFSLDFSPSGRLQYDSYESHVANRWNTMQRLDTQYRQLVDTLLEGPDYPYQGDIKFGTLVDRGSQELGADGKPFGPAYGLAMEELQLDGDYDIRQLARQAGHLVIYLEEPQRDTAQLAQRLLEFKALFDGADIPFYSIDLDLEPPRGPDGAYQEGTRVAVKQFLYEDITEQGLEERVAQNQAARDAFYEQLDKEKEGQMAMDTEKE